jgi:epoxyqueuosine reductase
MNTDLNAKIIDQGLKFGACLVGIANFNSLTNSPSHTILDKFDRPKIVGLMNLCKAIPRDLSWPAFAKSIIVMAVEHPEDKPELDWWQDGLLGGTPGNQLLINICSRLSKWLETEKGFLTQALPYHIEKGGTFLKDAAVIAGLGCIGKNNLFVTPDYGSRVRLRAILLDAQLPTTGLMDFDPCQGCSMPCRTVCPQGAFQKKIYDASELGLNHLPGRSGVYNRLLCNHQMELDIGNGEITEADEHIGPVKIVKYCRQCEFACPVGKV